MRRKSSRRGAHSATGVSALLAVSQLPARNGQLQVRVEILIGDRNDLRKNSVDGSPMTVDGRLYTSATSETRDTVDGFVTDELLDFYTSMVDAGTPLPGTWP